MDPLEHEGKSLLRSFGVRTPRGEPACTPAEAGEVAADLGVPCMVKAQVAAGGRSRAGGIVRAGDAGEAAAAASRILGMEIGGQTVAAVLVEEEIAHEQESYAAISIDRSERAPLLVLSNRGGVGVEELAAEMPGAVARVRIDPLYGWGDYLARKAFYKLGMRAASSRALSMLLERLWSVFVESDATLVEVNPLVEVEGEPLALDAKVSIDESALYRRPALAELYAARAADALERLADERQFPYVRLDGSIGILANGAGLAMSTLDAVAQMGGRAANFLDIGGGASADRIVEALEVVLADERVLAVFVNVFGGITRCDEVARGLFAAYQVLTPRLPVVVRLAGTNAEEGLAILRAAALPGLQIEASMRVAAELAVAAARQTVP